MRQKVAVLAAVTMGFLTVGAATPALAADSFASANEPVPGDAPKPMVRNATEPALITVNVATNGTVTGTVTDALAEPVPSAAVAITATATGETTVTVPTVTNSTGEYQVHLPVPGATWTVTAATGPVTASGTATIGSRLTITAVVPATVSETVTQLRIATFDRSVPAKTVLTITQTEPTRTVIRIAHQVTTNATGQFTVPIRPWRNPQLVITATRRGLHATATITASTRPTFPVIRTTVTPNVAHPLTHEPVGSGANPTITRITAPIWAGMQGLTWHPGCIPRTRLRTITTNYLGFDGYRHRGTIVVNTAISGKTANLFTRLYRARFPIRQLRPVDFYGPNRNRPGANDYKSMAADNTSGFNCRYVVGKEAQHVQSPHASGRSLDINTWENPYVSPTGVYPNRYYLNRSRRTAATWIPGTKPLTIMKSEGCRWGGSYQDFHHFDC